ncbi:MAG: hypothetical protein HRK26_01985 [Rickettsiaceae bacterium H1]|nr:hypothetical protein [Rickettsiaceae bacterium H1]
MLPQLDYSTYPSQIFWLIVNFIFLYYLISFFIIPKIDNIIAKRSKLLENNKKTVEENYSLIKLNKEKYKEAIDKANSLATDIHKDNRIMMEEYKSQLHQNLQEEIKKLNSINKQQFNGFKNKIKSELIEEVVNIIGIYYRELTQEEIKKNEIFNKFKDQIENKLL